MDCVTTGSPDVQKFRSQTKPVFSYLLIFTLFAATIISFNTQTSASAFAGGAGTIGDPYQISNCTELQDMQSDLDAYYVLDNNIDLVKKLCADRVIDYTIEDIYKLEEKKLEVVVSNVFKIEEIVQAHVLADSGHKVGNILIKFD